MATHAQARIAPTVIADATVVLSHDLRDQIRTRAYELYEQRGMAEGHELEDWLQAETELLQTFQATASN